MADLLLRFFNSAVVAIASTFLTVFVGGLAVYGLTRFRQAALWIPALGNDGILFAILAYFVTDYLLARLGAEQTIRVVLGVIAAIVIFLANFGAQLVG